MFNTRPQAECQNTHPEPYKVLRTETHTTLNATEASNVRSFRTSMMLSGIKDVYKARDQKVLCNSRGSYLTGNLF